MQLQIKGLAALRAKLDAIRPAEIMAQALAREAERLAGTVRDALATPPGGDHSRPWAQTGALHDSIGSTAEGLSAAVGSNDPAAAPQERGTRTLPPRPFLAPAAAAEGEAIARTIGSAVADALRGTVSAPTPSATAPSAAAPPERAAGPAVPSIRRSYGSPTGST